MRFIGRNQIGATNFIYFWLYWRCLLIDFLIFIGGLELLFAVGLKFPKGIRFYIMNFKISIFIYLFIFYNKLSIFMSMNVKVQKFIGVATEFLSHFC
jgi:hypothetical protein